MESASLKHFSMSALFKLGFISNVAIRTPKK